MLFESCLSLSLPLSEAPFVVAELDMSTGQNNITLETRSLKQAKAEVSLFLRKSVSALKGSGSVCNVETHFPYSLTANFRLTERRSLCTMEFPLLSSIFSQFPSHWQTLSVATTLLLYRMNNLGGNCLVSDTSVVQ